MRSARAQVSEEEFECLSNTAWVFLGVAVVPHILMLAGQQAMVSIAACACFSVTMGPLAVLHTYLLATRLGFISPMAWLAALIFSQVWFASICWMWRRDRKITLEISSSIFLFSAVMIWLRLAPAI